MGGGSRSPAQSLSQRENNILQRVLQKKNEVIKEKEEGTSHNDERAAFTQSERKQPYMNQTSFAQRTPERNDNSNQSFTEILLRGVQMSNFPCLQQLQQQQKLQQQTKTPVPDTSRHQLAGESSRDIRGGTPAKLSIDFSNNSSMRSQISTPLRGRKDHSRGGQSKEKDSQTDIQILEEEDLTVKEQIQHLKQREVRLKQVKQKLGLVELADAKTDQRKEVNELIETIKQGKLTAKDESLPKFHRTLKFTQKPHLTFSSTIGYDQLKKRLNDSRKGVAAETKNRQQPPPPSQLKNLSINIPGQEEGRKGEGQPQQLQVQSWFKQTHHSLSPKKLGGGEGIIVSNRCGSSSNNNLGGGVANTPDSSIISKNFREDLARLKLPAGKQLRASSSSNQILPIGTSETPRSQVEGASTKTMTMLTRRRAHEEYFGSNLTTTTTATNTPRFKGNLKLLTSQKNLISNMSLSTALNPQIDRGTPVHTPRMKMEPATKLRATTFYSNLMDLQENGSSETAMIMFHLKKGFSSISAELASARDGLMDNNKAIAKRISSTVIQQFRPTQGNN